MDIYDSALELPKELAFEHAHKPGQRYQVNAGRPQRIDVRPFGFLCQLRPETTGRNERGWNRSFPSIGQDSGRLNVAQDQGDVGRNRARRTGVGERDKVRTFSRT